MAVRVIVVRHGERLDEADRAAWSRIRKAANQHDPPLTQKGWKQARNAGDKIAHMLPLLDGNTGRPPFLYSSPTARTLSTAAGIAEAIDVMEVVPVYGLNCCAAAQQYGVASLGFPTTEPDQQVLGKVSVACWPPQGNDAAVSKAYKKHRLRTFVQCVAELANQHEAGDVILVVSHREGIWELYRHVGRKVCKADYCDVSVYTWDKKDLCFGSVDLGSFGGSADLPPSTAVPIPPLCADSARSALAAALATGKGQLLFLRSDVPLDAGAPTRLWETPGVRGSWVEGANARNGEIVELLSTPVVAENTDGQADSAHNEFVLIRLPCGAEGWTKVKNVQLFQCSTPRCSPLTTYPPSPRRKTPSSPAQREAGIGPFPL